MYTHEVLMCTGLGVREMLL